MIYTSDLLCCNKRFRTVVIIWWKGWIQLDYLQKKNPSHKSLRTMLNLRTVLRNCVHLPNVYSKSIGQYSRNWSSKYERLEISLTFPRNEFRELRIQVIPWNQMSCFIHVLWCGIVERLIFGGFLKIKFSNS